MIVGHGVGEAHEKKPWNLHGLLNYFLWWTCFVEKIIIEQASRKPPALMDLEVVSYFRKLSSGHCCVSSIHRS
jgi:hypothetical protein